MPVIEAERTNLNSKVDIHYDDFVGVGAFREVCAGTFLGGNRNQQAAVCKKFKDRYMVLEDQFFESDDRITVKAIDLANLWNMDCDEGREILVNSGDKVVDEYQDTYLIEPRINDFVKFTSNTGTILHVRAGEAMEAFTHFCYHKTGGQLIVCDLQGRYKPMKKKFNKKKNCYEEKSRYELTDLAISSRKRGYGPTDMGEKGIEQFFFHHVCNQYCQGRWARPRDPSTWFDESSGTSMLSSEFDSHLALTSKTQFILGLGDIMEAEGDSDDADY